MQGLAWLLLMIGGLLMALTSASILIVNYINNRGGHGSEEAADVLQVTLTLALGVLFAVEGHYELVGALSQRAEATLSITIIILSLALAAHAIKKRPSMKHNGSI